MKKILLVNLIIFVLLFFSLATISATEDKQPPLQETPSEEVVEITFDDDSFIDFIFLGGFPNATQKDYTIIDGSYKVLQQSGVDSTITTGQILHYRYKINTTNIKDRELLVIDLINQDGGFDKFRFMGMGDVKISGKDYDGQIFFEGEGDFSYNKWIDFVIYLSDTNNSIVFLLFDPNNPDNYQFTSLALPEELQDKPWAPWFSNIPGTQYGEHEIVFDPNEIYFLIDEINISSQPILKYLEQNFAGYRTHREEIEQNFISERQSFEDVECWHRIPNRPTLIDDDTIQIIFEDNSFMRYLFPYYIEYYYSASDFNIIDDKLSINAQLGTKVLLESGNILHFNINASSSEITSPVYSFEILDIVDKKEGGNRGFRIYGKESNRIEIDIFDKEKHNILVFEGEHTLSTIEATDIMFYINPAGNEISFILVDPNDAEEFQFLSVPMPEEWQNTQWEINPSLDRYWENFLPKDELAYMINFINISKLPIEEYLSEYTPIYQLNRDEIDSLIASDKQTIEEIINSQNQDNSVPFEIEETKDASFENEENLHSLEGTIEITFNDSSFEEYFSIFDEGGEIPIQNALIEDGIYSLENLSKMNIAIKPGSIIHYRINAKQSDIIKEIFFTTLCSNENSEQKCLDFTLMNNNVLYVDIIIENYFSAIEFGGDENVVINDWFDILLYFSEDGKEVMFFLFDPDDASKVHFNAFALSDDWQDQIWTNSILPLPLQDDETTYKIDFINISSLPIKDYLSKNIPAYEEKKIQIIYFMNSDKISFDDLEFSSK